MLEERNLFCKLLLIDCSIDKTSERGATIEWLLMIYRRETPPETSSAVRDV